MATAEETYLTDYSTYSSNALTDLVAEGFNASSNVGSHSATATGANSYTLSVCSQSGSTWSYDSGSGQITKGAGCTFTAGT
jgi:hypothetical protein